jgi:hypothetical protein
LRFSGRPEHARLAQQFLVPADVFGDIGAGTARKQRDQHLGGCQRG